MDRVIISGAAQGIGHALAIGYAKQGYEVMALDIDDAFFGEKNIHFFKIDLLQEEQIKDCFAQIKEQFGPVAILINNGAISKFNKSINKITIAEFDKVIATNLRGAFICAKYFVEINEGAGYGRIINIASTRYQQNEAGWDAYGASKGGIVSLTNSLCVSLSNTKITVNAISPGWIETQNYDDLRPEDHYQHPSGRVGKPQDILRACLFLSDKENDFINGANLLVDGGMTKKMIYCE